MANTKKSSQPLPLKRRTRGSASCTKCTETLPKDHVGKKICRSCLDGKGITVDCPSCGKQFQSEVYNPAAKKKAPDCPACRRKHPNNPLLNGETPPPEGKEISGAQRELASRMLARKYLWAYVLRFDSNYKLGWFHRDLSSRLEEFMRQVERGESPRLMIQVPPRHGKSRLTSQEFSSWALGHHPEWEIIAASYAVSLPVDFSRLIRERLRDVAYQVVFTGTELSSDSQSVESWRTSKGGGFLAAGVGGPITGKGAHIFIIDDPVKNAEEAESQAMRNNVWNWYTSTAYTRLAPGGGVLVIQTRWHSDDLSGRIEHQMRNEGGEHWEIVRYPAEAVEDERFRKKGEALHPERYDESALARIKKAVGPRVWNALYQQNPVPDEGAYFTKSMLRFYDTAPELLEVYNTWDLAIGQKQQNDWTVGLQWGVDKDDNIYVLNLVRARMDALQIVEAILDMWVAHPNTQACGIEEGQIKLTMGPMLEKRVAERRLFNFHQIPLKPGRQDKVARARTIQGRMQQGRVFFPKVENAPWMERLIDEMLAFPFGKNDDQVDTLGYCGLMAAEVTPPTIDTAFKNADVGWKAKLQGFVANGRKVKSWLEA